MHNMLFCISKHKWWRQVDWVVKGEALGGVHIHGRWLYDETCLIVSGL